MWVDLLDKFTVHEIAAAVFAAGLVVGWMLAWWMR